MQKRNKISQNSDFPHRNTLRGIHQFIFGLILANGLKFLLSTLSLMLIVRKTGTRDWGQKKTVCGCGEPLSWPVDEKKFSQAEPEKQTKKVYDLKNRFVVAKLISSVLEKELLELNYWIKGTQFQCVWEHGIVERPRRHFGIGIPGIYLRCGCWARCSTCLYLLPYL